MCTNAENVARELEYRATPKDVALLRKRLLLTIINEREREREKHKT